MAVTPQKVVRGTPVLFEQVFLEEDGTPIAPSDPSAYPAVSIVTPDEEIIQSGVAMSAGDGRWRFSWFCPADVDMSGPDNPWRIDWVIMTNVVTANGGRQIERQSNFVVIDNIEAFPDERAYTDLVFMGNPARAIVKFKNAQTEVYAELINRANGTCTNISPGIQTIQSDGFYHYYVDTAPLTAAGMYNVVWNTRQTVLSPLVTTVQQIRVPEMIFWWNQPSLRMLIDKVQKKVGHVQAYSDSDMYEYFIRGSEYVNAVNPITGWTLVNWPQAYGMNNFLIMAAAWWGLQAQYLSEAELKFNFSGQRVTLDVDRTGNYEAAISRLKDYLDSQLQNTKRNMLRRVSVGAVSGRPYDFGLQSLVTKVHTNTGGDQILPLFSRLGLV